MEILIKKQGIDDFNMTEIRALVGHSGVTGTAVPASRFLVYPIFNLDQP